jgi:uncharacterized protein (DUF1697 family)
MPSWRIALLRGINVGRAKRIAMADLRALVEGLGYGDVRTLLNSGNVLFTAPPRASAADAAGRIEKAIEATLGISSRVTVLTGAELATIVEGNPLLDVAHDPSKMLVAVLNTKADRAKLEPLLEEDWGDDRLALGDRVAYMWCAAGLLQSKLADTAGRILRDAATTRNWATMLKLHAITSAKK